MLAVLASILFPLFGRVRALPCRVKCASNLRQIGLAFSLYAQDWNGWWPSPGGLVGDRVYWSQSGKGGLTPYLPERGIGSVWCCPLLTEWHGKYPPRSYSMNSYLRDVPDMEFPDCIRRTLGIRTGVIQSPNNTILIFEGVPRSREFQDDAYTEDQTYYIYRCANWTWVRGYTGKINHTVDPGKPWHDRLNNYLYCDGHVLSRAPGKKTTGSLSTYAEMGEWYVDKKRFRKRYASYAP